LLQRPDQLLAGVLRNDVQRIIDVADDCLYVHVASDYSEVTTRVVPPTSNYLGLTPKIAGDDPEGRNPTAWMMFMDGINADGGEPDNPCAGR
jgi:hypothetical protein